MRINNCMFEHSSDLRNTGYSAIRIIPERPGYPGSTRDTQVYGIGIPPTSRSSSDWARVRSRPALGQNLRSVKPPVSFASERTSEGVGREIKLDRVTGLISLRGVTQKRRQIVTLSSAARTFARSVGLARVEIFFRL